MQKGSVDAHCHFFNGAFAFDELLEIGWRWLHDHYPYKQDEQLRLKALNIIPPELEKLINYVASLFAAIIRNPEENYNYEQHCYTASLWKPSGPLITAPLMMDIFFMFDNGSSCKQKSKLLKLPAEKKRAAFSPSLITKQEQYSFDEFAEEMKQKVLRACAERVSRNERALDLKATSTAPVAAELDRVIKEFKSGSGEEPNTRGLTARSDVQMTRGYRKHLKALMDLKKKSPETVFPFLAVDPRRIGIEQLVKMQVIDGKFQGVKLYCPLGYLPSHPDLYPVYKHCIEHDIPITCHTSPGGFQSKCGTISTLSRKRDGTVVKVLFDETTVKRVHEGDTAQSLFFARPQNWLEVLENSEFSKLRINFAHFGGSDHVKAYIASNGSSAPDNWTAEIISLMERFEHVYADIAYCPDVSLQEIEAIIKQHPIVEERLMFGTDFVMIIMTNESLEEYFNHYTVINSRLAGDNAAAFLRL